MPHQAKRVVLVSRPVGEPKASDFRIEEYAPPDARRGPGAAAHHLAVARSLYARAHERRPVLCGAGADRRRDGGRHGLRGDRLEQSRLCQGRHRAVARRLADPCAFRRQGIDANRSETCTDLDRHRRARHARHDRLYGTARYRQAASRRDRRGRRGLRRGRLGGRADRQDQGRARGRHRRRQGQMRLRQQGAWLRRLPRSPRSRSGGEAEGSLPEGHRRLFRECRRRGVRGGVSAAQSRSRAFRSAA